MDKIKIRVITFCVFLICFFCILIGTDIYARSLPYHPDANMTVYNPTTDKITQAYAIGKMQVYIDQTYRMEMPLWAYYVKAEGTRHNNGEDFNEISDSGNENLSMLRNDSSNDPNPFIMRLNIKNISEKPIAINANNFKITSHDREKVYSPDANWQEVMNKAGMFAGVAPNNEIAPNEEKILWLVYSTPSQQQVAGAVYQEYVRINYDSDSDIFATKVEFPFNYTVDFQTGNFESERDNRYQIGIFLIFAWIALCGTAYYKISKNYE